MIIFRYISNELYSRLLSITLVLLIIFITNQFIHYVENAGKGMMTMTTVLQIMSLQIPLLLGYLIPLGLYLGILITYGRLYVDSEMTVLSACGMSRAQLLGITMINALVVTLIVAVIILWIEPVIQGYRTRILESSLGKVSIQKIVPRRFQVVGGNTVFYTKKLNRKTGIMQDIFLAKKEHVSDRWDVILAKTARQQTVKGLEGRFIVFQKGYRYLGEMGTQNFQTISFQKYGIRLIPVGIHLDDWPNDVSTLNLVSLIRSERVPSRRRALEAMLQWRLAMPISVIVFALLAFPLSDVKPRSGKFARLFPAILIYIVYADLIILGRTWIHDGVISPSLGLWWIHGLAVLLAIVLNLYRIGWRRFFSFSWLRRSFYATS